MCAVLVEWITIIPLFQFSVHIRNMICTEIGKYGLLGAKKSWCKAREAAAALLLVSTPPTMGGGRGGEGCSHPAAHQIGRRTISNTSSNSLDLPIHVLRVVWRSVMQSCQWFAPPSCARLDCRHCTRIAKITSQASGLARIAERRANGSNQEMLDLSHLSLFIS